MSNYKYISLSNTHLISNNFLSLQTPFAIALTAMAGEGSYEVGGRGGRIPRKGWLSKVVRLFNYAFRKPLPKPALPPPVGISENGFMTPRLRGPNPSFLFLTQGTLPALLRIRKKTNLLFCLNLFKSESVERTHLYSYVFH